MNIGAISVIFIIFFIIISGLFKKVPVFDLFTLGAKEGILASLSIAPSLVALITAVNMLKVSGFLDIFTSFVSLFTSKIGVPAEIIPLALLRPISGSGSIAILDNLLSEHGPDSQIGQIASIIMGATETTFYTVAVYLSSAKIKNSKYTIFCALLADFVTVCLSIFIIKTYF